MPANRKEEDMLDDEDTLPSDETELQSEIETLKKALLEAQEKAESNWERLLRKEADLQNVQRRAEQDVENARKSATERFAAELVSVMDSLEQGLHYTEQGNPNLDAIVEGTKLTKTSLQNVFQKFGITTIEPLGEAFDPTYHEALTMQETDKMDPNKVLQVIQKGYVMNGRLLRPARVIVSKAPG